MSEQLTLPGRKFRPKKPPPALEIRTHIALADLLRLDAAPGWFWSHVPSGEKRSPATAALLQRMGVQPGMPDFLLIGPDGVHRWLELKRGARGVVTEAQERFASMCRTHGVSYCLARSFAEAEAQLRLWGALAGRVRTQ